MRLIFFNGNKATKLLMTNHAKWHETEEFEDRNSSKVKIKMWCPWNSHTVYFCKRQRSFQTMTKRNFNITFVAVVISFLIYLIIEASINTNKKQCDIKLYKKNVKHYVKVPFKIDIKNTITIWQFSKEMCNNRININIYFCCEMHCVCMISTFLGKGSLFIMFWKGEGSKQRSFNIYHQEIGTKGNEKSTYIGNSYQNNY